MLSTTENELQQTKAQQNWFYSTMGHWCCKSIMRNWYLVDHHGTSCSAGSIPLKGDSLIEQWAEWWHNQIVIYVGWNSAVPLQQKTLSPSNSNLGNLRHNLCNAIHLNNSILLLLSQLIVLVSLTFLMSSTKSLRGYASCNHISWHQWKSWMPTIFGGIIVEIKPGVSNNNIPISYVNQQR